MPTDARGELEDGRSGHRAQKDGRVALSRYGRAVVTLAGKDAERFLARVAGPGHQEAQRLMARDTGHFRRGSERQEGEKRV